MYLHALYIEIDCVARNGQCILVFCRIAGYPLCSIGNHPKFLQLGIENVKKNYATKSKKGVINFPMHSSP